MKGNKLLTLLNEKGISCYKLSKLTKLSESTISKIVNNKNKNVRFTTFKKIATALEVTTDELNKYLEGDCENENDKK